MEENGIEKRVMEIPEVLEMFSVRLDWVTHLAHSSGLVPFESYCLTTFCNQVYILSYGERS